MVFSNWKKWKNVVFAAVLAAELLPVTMTPLSSSADWMPGKITTVAGNGTLGFGGDNGPATSAQLTYPKGVGVDGSGNLFIADYSNRIRKVNTSGIITTVAGNGTPGYGGDGGQATSASLNSPAGIALDSNGNLFIADTSNARIRKVAGNTITTVAGGNQEIDFSGNGGDGGLATSAWLNSPQGVAVDSNGNLFITNINRIRKVTASTGIIDTVVGNGASGSGGDGGLAASAQLNYSVGVAVDSGDNLFIADSGNNRIRKVTASTGIITTVAGNGASGSGGDGGLATSAQLNFPVGVALDSAGNLFIADRDNQRVRRVDAATGIITTVAGTGTGGYNEDNITATGAQLFNPYGVVADSGGNYLFIADTENNRIRKVVKAVDIVPPATATVTVNLFYRASTMPAAFSGTAADDATGMGLNANSATFTLRRGSDSQYWTGSAWQAGAAWLATSHAATAGGASVNWTNSAAMPAWADGSYTVQARAIDKYSNTTTGAAVSFTFDSTAPVITFAPMLGFTGPLQAQQIGWTSTDANITPNSAILEGFNGTSWLPIATGQPATGSSNWTVPAVNTSAAKARVTVTDLAGNTTTTETWTFVIDSTIPTASIYDIPATVSYLQAIAGSSSDPAPGQMDKVQVVVNDTTGGTYWDGAAWVGTETWLEAYRNTAGTGWAFPVPTLVNDNNYTVKAKTTDRSLNVSTIATDSFTFSAAQAGGVPGDANGDGLVNALDITKTERIIAGLD
ncbi:MAG: Ig-like domain repeat protein [Chloroflexi bacterium]|nr:Ig-like domain repeat protein [Chloroflexota bacterium]